MQFEWPGAGHTAGDTALFEPRPLARKKSWRRGVPVPPPTDDGDDLRRELDEARAMIARLEADRHAARVRIDELEAASAILQTRVATQRHRLLVLERQLEDANVQPALDASPSGSWFERLFGGPSSVSTV